MMIAKLNKFFQIKGRLLTEAEYMQEPTVPYRTGVIKKYLRSWPAMIAYIKAIYPEWGEKRFSPTKPVNPENFQKPVESDPLEALRAIKAEETSDEDE